VSTQLGAPKRSDLGAFTRSELDVRGDPADESDGPGVRNLLLHSGYIYVCGTFEGIHGESRNYLAAYNITTGALDSWDPAPDGPVYAMAVNGTNLYVAGDFANIAGVARTRIAKLNLAGSGAAVEQGWTSVVPSANGLVRTIEYYTTNASLFLGGDFTEVNGTARAYLAEIRAIGASAGDLQSFQCDTNQLVRWIHLQNTDVTGGTLTTTLIVGGDFTTINGEARNYLAMVMPANGAVRAWDPSPDGIVRHTAQGLNQNLYVGGDFTNIGGGVRNRAALFEAETGVVNLLATDWNCDNSVHCISRGLDTASSVVGSFTNMSGLTRNRAGQRIGTGIPTGWDPNCNDKVFTSWWDGSNSKVYLGGNFTEVGGSAKVAFARVNTGAGTLDTGFPS